ncbi:MAG TPA: alpha/beta hydrolase [Pirellulaceae bacterium]|nr:alpha/beta hydrolase [Pirellulaceae bacterium]
MRWLCLLGMLWCGSVTLAAEPVFTREQDIVYGRKHGMALTMDVIAPTGKPNGAAVIWIISGGWTSNHDVIHPEFVEELPKRGYTVFAVVHGSQPKFTIPEAVDDLRRSVRFIRANAERFKIDPNRIGVTGASAGGHLSLMLGTTSDEGNSKAGDPVDRQSCRVQAVGCFFPPTDFLNYGKPGETALGTGILAWLKPPFDFNELDKNTKKYERIADEKRRLEIGKQISPVNAVTKDDAPTLIIHGDADKLVPIQQAELFMEQCKAAGVEHQLVVKPGAAHGWPSMLGDIRTLADWFDKQLAAK